jgi:hypothetical protein
VTDRWEIEISDLVTGSFMVRGERYGAGRFTTEDPYVATYFTKHGGGNVRVRQLDQDEEVKAPVTYDTTVTPSPGPLSKLDMASARAPAEEACREPGCGVVFKDLNQHGRASGHDIRGFGAAATKE